MKSRANASTSSVWGSAVGHFTEFGDRRFLLDTASIPESKVSLHIDNQNDILTGSKNVVCSTEAEYKANKLNRSEQAKLENLQMRMTKEKEMTQRRFQQNERAFRAKSANLRSRTRSVEPQIIRPTSLTNTWMPNKSYLKLPKSPSYNKKVTKECDVCAQIQGVIRSYEIEGHRRGVFEHTTPGDHSTCLFSDVQVKTFLNVLESDYLEEIPSLRSKFRESGLLSPFDRHINSSNRSREEIDNGIATKNIEARIRQFCAALDSYNKENVSIPKEVRDRVEKVRLADAIAKPRRELSVRSKRKQDAKEKFKN